MKLFGPYVSYQDLVNKKNELFANVITNPRIRYYGRGYDVITKLEQVEEDSILLHFGVEKKKEIYKADFSRTQVKDYPNIYVYFDNRSDQQLIAIQNNPDAFTDPQTVANIVKESLSRPLAGVELAIYIEQLFDEQEFWDTIKKYQDRIIRLRFEFIKPNLANISKTAVDQLKYLKNSLNSHRTELEFKAPEHSTLENLNPNNEEIDGLVSYNKEGGGPPPQIRVKGMRHYIKTTESETKLDIGEFEGNADDLVKMLKALIK